MCLDRFGELGFVYHCCCIWNHIQMISWEHLLLGKSNSHFIKMTQGMTRRVCADWSMTLLPQTSGSEN